MTSFIETRLALAKSVERHRKQIKYRLAAAVVLGCLLGYHSSAFLEGLLVSNPEHTGFPLNTWAGIRETTIAIFAVHGVIIWPTIFIVIDLFLIRRRGAILADKIGNADNQARIERAAETKQKIAEAKRRGLI